MTNQQVNYLLENLNTSVSRAAELTDDPKLLRYLGAVKKVGKQLAEASLGAKPVTPAAVRIDSVATPTNNPCPQD
ncbi:hypothetical protein [Bordetella sp. BOR01]|uniref:hypothetical protein n=1 Tax=Bordetella sp. BOR01 TaxID=2854779 RepID=UPI001C45D08A|nr:hypothetical protein [Bordetella sp. BOR01]MBV7482928.1 hypothetical protein [Bordetella sp. BOR01]